jgi:hypothetical protein
MGTIDIGKVIGSYSGTDINTWDAFVKAVAPPNQAVGQDESTPFGKTFRGAESKDCAGNKYSFGITNVSAFAGSESNNGIFAAVNGASGSVSAGNVSLFVGSASAGITQGVALIGNVHASTAESRAKSLSLHT